MYNHSKKTLVALAIAYGMAATSALAQTGKVPEDEPGAPNPTDINCVDTILPANPMATGGTLVKECHFEEQWQYMYGANILEVVEATAAFAQANVINACASHGMEFGRYQNPKAIGGISDLNIETGERNGGVYAKISGTFYCIPR